MDQVSCISDPYRETQGFGAEITYVQDDVPRSSHPLAEDKNLKRLENPDPYKSERMLDRIKAAEQFKNDVGGKYSILGWVEGPAAEAADLRDVMNFLMDIAGDPGYACDLMDRCVEVGIDFALAQIEAGCDTIGIGDAIASQISPQMYENYIQPREKQLIEAIQDAGAYAKLHICGDITHLLPGIGNLGADIVDVDYMVDLTEVRDAVGDSVVITGNIDPSGGVKEGTPESIRNAVRQMYETAGNPYFVNAGCEIPSGTPPENLKALCEPLEYRK
jgi:MtaA/CmuA family methyltransferase